MLSQQRTTIDYQRKNISTANFGFDVFVVQCAYVFSSFWQLLTETSTFRGLAVGSKVSFREGIRFPKNNLMNWRNCVGSFVFLVGWLIVFFLVFIVCPAFLVVVVVVVVAVAVVVVVLWLQCSGCNFN